jgi:hypothetical protein
VSEQDNLPRTAFARGTYEVWFLTLTDPRSGAGYWIRSTLLNRRHGGMTAGVWFARFDPADPARTFGIHRTFPEAKVAEDVFEVGIGDSLMRSGRASGTVAGGGHQAQWDLQFPTGQSTYFLLPDLVNRRAFAPSRALSPNPQTVFSGSVTIDGETTEIIAASGQQSHVYGSRHGERWAWAACSDFIDEDATLHVLTAQARRGPITTPFLTTVGVRWQDRRIHLWNLGRRRPFGLGKWRLDVGNRRYRLTGWIEAPAWAILRARYEDPDGTPRYCHNSEIASSRVALFERRAGGFDEVALLEARGTTHAEWAGRTPAAAVEREFAEAGP